MGLTDRKVQAGLAVAVLLVGSAVTWSVLRSSGAEDGSVAAVDAPPAAAGPDLSVEALKEADPIDVWKLMRKPDLTEEQREELMQNAGEAMRQGMNERMNRYFSAQDADRDAVLDEQIDEWLQTQKRMAEYMEKEPLSEEEERDMKERWARMQAPSREERKDSFETGKSEDRSRMMAYFMAAKARMQQRGLEQPSRPGPGGTGGKADSGGRSRAPRDR